MKNDQLITLAIDPGASGGYAVCYGGLDEITLHKFESNADFIDHVLELEETHRGFLRSVVELVPPFAGKAIPSFTSFKLGSNCGFIEGVLRGRQIPVEYVSPRKWQASLSGLRGLTGSARKRKLRSHAHRLYPTLKATLATCDGLLLAHYHFNR